MPARRGRPLLLVVVLAGLLAGAPAGESLAHVKVKSTTPKRDGSASRSIGSVTVTFSGPIRRGTLRVTGADGRVASIGSGGRDPRRISRLLVELRRGLPRGSYRARWSLTAADGHRQRGSFRFRLR